MKLFACIATAGVIALTGLAPASVAAPAAAQHVVVKQRTVTRTVAHRPYRWRNRRVCSTKIRNHRRVRVCRTVRQRY